MSIEAYGHSASNIILDFSKPKIKLKNTPKVPKNQEHK